MFHFSFFFHKMGILLIMREKMKPFLKRHTRGKDAIGIFLGSIPYAMGVSLFLSPNQLAAGGVTGIAILLHTISNIKVGTIIWLLNIPILLLGFQKFGWHFLKSTVYALLCIAIWTNYLQRMPPITEDRILAAFVGGALVAIGMGVLFQCHATTGGMDIIVKLLKQRFPHQKTGSLFLGLDFLVLLLAGVVFKSFEATFYAALSVCVTTMVLDYVLYGGDQAKLIYIISNQSEILVEKLINQLDTGVTYLYGKGGFSKDDKKILMLVTSKKQALKVEELIKRIDPSAFLIVTKATEIYGEGYKNIFAEKL